MKKNLLQNPHSRSALGVDLGADSRSRLYGQILKERVVSKDSSPEKICLLKILSNLIKLLLIVGWKSQWDWKKKKRVLFYKLLTPICEALLEFLEALIIIFTLLEILKKMKMNVNKTLKIRLIREINLFQVEVIIKDFQLTQVNFHLLFNLK